MRYNGGNLVDIGDTILLTDDTNMSAVVGAEAIVLKVSDKYITIQWNNKLGTGRRSTQQDGGYLPIHFMLVRRMNEYELKDDKLNTFRNMISTFIDENCTVRINTFSQSCEPETEILFDESDGGKILEKSIKELFEEVKKM